MKVTESVRANPPRTLAALIGLTLPPLTIVVTRWLDGWLGDDPQLHAAVLALVLPVVAFVVSLAGKWAQQFTWPRHWYQEEVIDAASHANPYPPAGVTERTE